MLHLIPSPLLDRMYCVYKCVPRHIVFFFFRVSPCVFAVSQTACVCVCVCGLTFSACSWPVHAWRCCVCLFVRRRGEHLPPLQCERLTHFLLCLCPLFSVCGGAWKYCTWLMNLNAPRALLYWLYSSVRSCTFLWAQSLCCAIISFACHDLPLEFPPGSIKYLSIYLWLSAEVQDIVKRTRLPLLSDDLSLFWFLSAHVLHQWHPTLRMVWKCKAAPAGRRCLLRGVLLFANRCTQETPNKQTGKASVVEWSDLNIFSPSRSTA